MDRQELWDNMNKAEKRLKAELSKFDEKELTRTILADLAGAEERLKAELLKLDEQECTRRLLSELEASNANQ